jgi:4-amino-4-deoxy-L-arabinose transferase-like glycosyltransferase
MTVVRPAGRITHQFNALLTGTQPVSVPQSAGPDAGPIAEPHPSRHRPGRPPWSVPARAGIFALAAVLYTWNLAHIGMGNQLYAAAVRSGTQSWKALFFGSLDPGSFITVDKPPVALWVMELSARLFGFSNWSILLPDALAGVATVMVLYHLVRRWFGEPAAVLASLALTLTPVAVVIFRYNNPDAFLTLLLVLAAWACWRAIETGKTSGLVLSGALVGLAFLTKQLDAYIVVPALGLAYLWCGPPHLARRIAQLCWAALALLVSSAWWVAIVELWPKSARPYIGGSTDNSILNLIFGYNGFLRISGSRQFLFVDGGQGLLRMFDTELGGQVSWFLPLAIVGVVGGFCLTRGRERTDHEWAGIVLWGTTFLGYFAVYDDARGIFHAYYTVVMAPAVAALAGAGAVALWRLGQRSLRWAWVLPTAILGSVLWADALLARTRGYDPWLGPTVVVTGMAAALILFLYMTRRLSVPWVGMVAGVVAVVSVLAGPMAYSLTTVGNVTNTIPTAGPGGGNWGLGSKATVSPGLFDYLEHHQESATYLVAVNGSETAAYFIVQSGKPVIAMGGFTGLDPAPTLGDFEHLVATGKVRYAWIRRSTEGAQADKITTTAVDVWVQKHGAVVSSAVYGGGSRDMALYDLTRAVAGR